MDLDDDMAEYYNLGREQDRLTASPIGRLECLRTQELLRSRLPAQGRLVAVEGTAAALDDEELDWWLEEWARRKELLAALRRVEAEPSMLGATGHLLAFARKS
jgi:hypothetical protein